MRTQPRKSAQSPCYICKSILHQINCTASTPQDMQTTHPDKTINTSSLTSSLVSLSRCRAQDGKKVRGMSSYDKGSDTASSAWATPTPRTTPSTTTLGFEIDPHGFDDGGHLQLLLLLYGARCKGLALVDDGREHSLEW